MKGGKSAPERLRGMQQPQSYLLFAHSREQFCPTDIILWRWEIWYVFMNIWTYRILTLLCMFISAPLWCRYFTVSKWPHLMAYMRGVCPPYMSNNKKWEDAHNGQAHRGDRADTYLILYVHISTALVQILHSIQLARKTGRHERCASSLYVEQKEVRGCT
jgi:hypothetical protein